MHYYCNDVHLTTVSLLVSIQRLVININIKLDAETLTGIWNASGDGLGGLGASVVGYGRGSLQVPEAGI